MVILTSDKIDYSKESIARDTGRVLHEGITVTGASKDGTRMRAATISYGAIQQVMNISAFHLHDESITRKISKETRHEHCYKPAEQETSFEQQNCMLFLVYIRHSPMQMC